MRNTRNVKVEVRLQKRMGIICCYGNASIWSCCTKIMVMLYRKLILWYASLHDFHIMRLPRFKVNLMTQSNESKKYQVIRTIKNLSLKIQESTLNVKN